MVSSPALRGTPRISKAVRIARLSPRSAGLPVRRATENILLFEPTATAAVTVINLFLFDFSFRFFSLIFLAILLSARFLSRFFFVSILSLQCVLRECQMGALVATTEGDIHN